MIDLGTVKPGSTLRIPFNTFDKDDGSSITMTAFAVGDILVYKDGSTTERASTSGYTATTDFDAKTGKQIAIIDLADNTTAGFFASGSEYLVAIDAVTVDTVTTGGFIARFRIGYPGAVLDTTISELGASSNQSVFNLTNGPPENDVLNGMWAVIHDVAHAYQCAYVVIQDYIAATKTVILAANPPFGIAASDNFSVMGPAPLQPTSDRLTSGGRSLDVSATGGGGIDWANVESQTSTVGLTNTTIATTQKVDVETIKTNAVVNGGTVTFPTNATLASTTNITAGTITTATNVTTVNGLAANVITAAATAADFGAELATAIWTDTTAGDFTVAASIGKSIMNGVALGTGLTINAYTGNTPQTGDCFARLGAPAGASVSADIAAIEAQTDDIGAAGAGLTAVPWNAAWDAEVQSEVDDALVAQRLDELLNADSDIDGAQPPTVGSVFHELMSKTAGSFTFDQTTDSNEAIRDNMGTAQTGDSFARLGAPAGASVSADIAAIEAQTDDIGAAGAGLTAIPWNAAWDAEVQSEVQDALDGTLADSIPVDGTRPSISQALYMIVQFLLERAVSGTTVTVNKPDGTTVLMTLTLDNATSPTSITRAT